jgi:chemotaxis protein methyltransferase CheR
MNDREFGQLLEFLGLSWQGYRKVRKGAKRRIGLHMQALGCRSLQAYLGQLEQKADARRRCELALTVPISRFFRDRILWQTLQSRILPDWIEGGMGRVDAWSAGCACGEEVYSLKILWEHLSRTYNALPVLAVTATDLQPLHLERAKAGVYSSSSLREVPEHFKSACFDAQTGARRFTVKPALRAGIVWRRHDFLSGPPASGFHLILARNNLLTYYQTHRIRVPLEKMVAALSVGGYLVIGSHEKLPFQPALLKPHPFLPFAFEKAA